MKHQNKTHTLNKSLLRELAKLDTQTLFSEIYEKGYWGTSSRYPFYSGTGSHDETQTLPYVHAVKSLIAALPQSPVMIDLGCGDFNIGRQLYSQSRHYYAIDVVPELVVHNQQHFKADNLTFNCMDATTEKLPDADILLIRQVLQHLDNQSIKAIVDQLRGFEHIIVTEHVPAGSFTANIDKPPGPDNRMRIKSGVDISAPPFSLSGYQKRTLCAIETCDFPGIVETVLFTRN